MKTIAHFTDANGHDAGPREIRIHLSRNGAPFALVFGGVSYRVTGKHGPSLRAPVDLMMYEMRCDGDGRAWVDAAGKFVRLD